MGNAAPGEYSRRLFGIPAQSITFSKPHFSEDVLQIIYLLLNCQSYRQWQLVILSFCFQTTNDILFYKYANSTNKPDNLFVSPSLISKIQTSSFHLEKPIRPVFIKTSLILTSRDINNPNSFFTKERSRLFSIDFFQQTVLVPLAGLGPARYRYRGILSPLCLPISPQRQIFSFK